MGELSGLLMNCNKNILKAICAVVIDLTDVVRYDGKEVTSLSNDFDAEATNEKIERVLRNYKLSFTPKKVNFEPVSDLNIREPNFNIKRRHPEKRLMSNREVRT